jgi:uncharacterized Fe-S cluster-containing radical SAM superfamily protein
LKQGICGTDIEITNRCNLGCEYCYVQKGVDVLDLDRMREILIANEQKLSNKFNITGGEPLLYTELVKETAEWIKERYVQADITLYTNGLLLNKEMVGFCNENEIAVAVSLHAYERLNIELIQSINRVVYKLVIRPKERFADKVALMHERLRQIIEVRLDHTKLGLFSLDDLQLAAAELKGAAHMVTLAGFFPGKCRCDAYVVSNHGLEYKPDRHKDTLPTQEMTVGCPIIIARMGGSKYYKAYLYMLDVIENSKIEDAKEMFDFFYELTAKKQAKRKRIKSGKALWLYEKILGVL